MIKSRILTWGRPSWITGVGQLAARVLIGGRQKGENLKRRSETEAGVRAMPRWGSGHPDSL